MATFSVSLPDTMKEWIEARTSDGRFGDASDYVRDLIRRDQERVGAFSSLQQAIDEGFASGVSDRSMDDILEAARIEVRTKTHT